MYSTMGAYGKTCGTYLIKAKSLEAAKQKANKFMKARKLANIDIDDLAYVSKSTMWNSIRKLIDRIKRKDYRNTVTFRDPLGRSIIFAHEGKLKGVKVTSI